MAIGALAAAGGGYYWLETQGGAAPGSSLVSAAAESAAQERKPLYYRNPMGLPDTSPVPKKDPMGMDYIPVYADEAEEKEGEPVSAGGIRISTEKVQKLGVRTEPAQRRTLERAVRAVGRVEPDERRVHTVTAKFEGYVERLHVNATGQPVARGQPLFEVYSPELVSAQREYAIAAQGVEALKDADEEARAGMKQLAESSLLRLKNWDVSEAQIKALARSGEARRTLTFRSPATGVVTEKKAVQGMRFMPGEMLYQIADLSSVWVIADVFEQDIALVRTGTAATVRINAYPGQSFEGKVSFVYPTLNEATRTVPVRVELANPDLSLKPAMFAQVELPALARDAAVTVPASAVMDSGTRRIVLVELGEGRFEPREVSLGQRGDEHVEVLDGVKEGERVVIAANFLIDAESNLKAALGAFGAPEAQARSGRRSIGHRAEGTVDAIDAASETLEISHGPVATLNWPAMTMEFKAANTALVQGIKPGDAIAFEFVERGPGEWVVTAISQEAKAGGTAVPANHGAYKTHAGH
jgi:Cu(I)/Ag(I) efflux system membrane fusion protein